MASASLPSRRDPQRSGGPYQRAEIDIAIPLEATGTDLTAVLAAIAGNVFEVGEVTPDELLRAHPGPAFGVAGTRRQAGVAVGPIVGTIVKPSIGLTPEQTAERVDELAAGGVDFVKDDELLSSPHYSTVQARVAAIMPVIRRHAEHRGTPLMYAFNISADDVDEMRRRHDLVRDAGGTCVMVSVNQVGIAAVRSLRRHAELPIHGHRNGWAQLTRAPSVGHRVLGSAAVVAVGGSRPPARQRSGQQVQLRSA